MPRICRRFLYGNQLQWLMERDKLDAIFCRIGSGFVTQNTLREANECHFRINQILTQCQTILEMDSSHRHEPGHPPSLKEQQTAPIYVHSVVSDSQLK